MRSRPQRCNFIYVTSNTVNLTAQTAVATSTRPNTQDVLGLHGQGAASQPHVAGCSGVTTVIKRDGSTAPFDASRIMRAISQAWKQSGASFVESAVADVTAAVIQEINSRYITDVQVYEVQSVVEHKLMALGYTDVAAGYIQYRVNRDLQRSLSTDVQHQVSRLVAKDKSVINENANKDGRVYHTQRDLMAGSVAKSLGMAMLPPRVASAHHKAQIHFHDLDYSPFSTFHNCTLPDFEGMLSQGFHMGNAHCEQPKSIGTAATVLSQIITAVSSAQYGGVTVEKMDVMLAPYAQKSYDKHLQHAQEWIDEPEKQEQYARQHTAKDIYDAMQTIEYQINTISTTNGQTPFVTVGFGLGTNWFAREIQKAILNVRIKGLGADGRTAIFPKLVFTIKPGVNLEKTDPNYDIKRLAMECMSKRIYPDILSYEQITEITGSYKTPMGCRSFLHAWTDEQGQDVTTGRMNMGVVTLNLPRIAMESQGDLSTFWSLLSERMEIAHEGLRFRAERCRQATPENAPILFQEGAFGTRLAPGSDVSSVFDKGRASVSLGYIGLYEVATVFFGPNWEINPAAKAFTVDIVRKMKEATKQWTVQEGWGYGLYATPSESLTDRFAHADLEKFGVVEHITDKKYYTNSFHYDVRKSPTPFEKIDFERDYPRAGSSGGFIHYVEMPSLTHNQAALEAVIDYAVSKVGYFGVNSPVDNCFECGFTGDFTATEFGYHCPSCNNSNPETCDVTKRVCGYLSQPVTRPVAYGRQQELKARVKHVKDTP